MIYLTTQSLIDGHVGRFLFYASIWFWSSDAINILISASGWTYTSTNPLEGILEGIARSRREFTQRLIIVVKWSTRESTLFIVYSH